MAEREQSNHGPTSDGSDTAAELLMIADRLSEIARDLLATNGVGTPTPEVVRSSRDGDHRPEGDLVAQHSLDTLGDPTTWRAADGYASLALCVLDSVWSVGVRYRAVVLPLIDRYRTYRAAVGADPDADTVEDLLGVIADVGGPEAFAETVVVNRNRTSPRNGILKAQAARDAAEALRAVGVSNAAQLRDADDATMESAERAWRAVRGQGSGITWQYLLMLVGVEQIKPDRMIRRFVAEALGYGPYEAAVSVAQAEQAVRHALTVLQADYPDLTLRALDRTIWGFQSGTGSA